MDLVASDIGICEDCIWQGCYVEVVDMAGVAEETDMYTDVVAVDTMDNVASYPGSSTRLWIM